MSYVGGTVVFLSPCGVRQFRVSIPRTLSMRTKGLRGASYVPNGTGMLIEFDPRTVPRLTMEGVAIPLDMVFVDVSGKVSQVLTAMPETKVVVGPVGTQYVVELGAGEAKDIRRGQRAAVVVTG
jgi:uncharacterized membrane protein (UPF0127 family)